MYTIILPAAVVLLAGIGAAKLSSASRRANARRNFCSTYLNRLTQFVRNLSRDEFDQRSYRWLNRRSVDLQRLLGGFDELECDAAACVCILGSPTVVHTMANLRAFRSADYRDIRKLDAVIARSISAAEGTLVDVKLKLRNPIIWLYEGIQSTLLSPILVLGQIGALPDASVRRIRRGPAIQMLTFVAASTILLATVYAIIPVQDGMTYFASHVIGR